jgi:hypothetical protein
MGFRTSVEQEIKAYLQHAGIPFTDHTTAYKQLDFTITFAPEQLFYLEVKEKRQQYNPQNWPQAAPEAEMFILDDLTVRKCLAYSPWSGVLVRDNLTCRYVFFSVVDLALMPKTRVNRAINRNQPANKGKWIINLRNGQAADQLADALAYAQHYLRGLPTTLFDVLECYGDYVDEDVERGGITRNPEHWQVDVQATR